MKKYRTGKKISITKASGQSAFYNEEKVKRSLIHAGASQAQAQAIAAEVGSRLYDGMSTREIFKIAYRMLKDQAGHLAARYNLKKAMMELGPSGFPFEKYVSEIFRHEGYHTATGKIMPGKCVKHEVDVWATREEKTLMIECKYHSQQGIFCDVKVPLYIHSRFNDISAVLHPQARCKGWIITNTRFSDDAIIYSTCAGLRLMSWDYPAASSLKTKIDALGLYPITCLTTLTLAEKQILLEKNKVLCLDIKGRPELLQQAGLSSIRIKKTLEETEQLCATANHLKTLFTENTLYE